MPDKIQLVDEKESKEIELIPVEQLKRKNIRQHYKYSQYSETENRYLRPFKFDIPDLDLLTQQMALENKAHNTQYDYYGVNRLFLKFINKKPSEITEVDIKSFLEYKMGEGCKDGCGIGYIQKIYKSLRYFYDDVLHKNLFDNIPFPKIGHIKLTEYLTKEEINKILEIASEIGFEYYLGILLIYSSGLRSDEFLNLKHKDLELENLIGNVRFPKGGEERKFKLSNKFVEQYKRYYNGKNIDPNDYFSPVQYSGYWNVFQKISKKLNKRIYFHIFRHSFATHLLEDGIDIRIIAELLGHKGLDTVIRYTKVTNTLFDSVRSPADRSIKDNPTEFYKWAKVNAPDIYDRFLVDICK